MKTLVIHPNDKSTDFLKRIYSTIFHADVMTAFSGVDEVDNHLMTHDRIVMMGHGSPSGLFSAGNFTKNTKTFWTWGGFMIDDYSAPLLRPYTSNIFIWCNADKFVRKNGLKGFFTGMFISEVGEAKYCGLGKIPWRVVRQSNRAFSHIMSRHINKPIEEMYRNVILDYGKIASYNPVARYNWNRLFLAT